MGIPKSRIDQSRQLDRALVRKRRNYTEQKDWHKKDNLFYHPESYIRFKAYLKWDSCHRDDENVKKSVLKEKFLKKEFKNSCFTLTTAPEIWYNILLDN